MRVDWTLSAMVETSGDFRLEVDGWDLDETTAPSEKAPGKRRKLSLSLNREQPPLPIHCLFFCRELVEGAERASRFRDKESLRLLAGALFDGAAVSSRSHPSTSK